MKCTQNEKKQRNKTENRKRMSRQTSSKNIYSLPLKAQSISFSLRLSLSFSLSFQTYVAFGRYTHGTTHKTCKYIAQNWFEFLIAICFRNDTIYSEVKSTFSNWFAITLPFFFFFSFLRFFSISMVWKCIEL